MDALVPVPRALAPVSIETARLALDAAGDIATVASLVGRLEVIRVAARKAKMSAEAQNDWATVKLEAERKAGRMLAELRRKGGLRAGRPNADEPSALADLGIAQQQSSRWQRLAALPEGRFRRWLEETRAADGEVTEAGLFALAARSARWSGGGLGGQRPAPLTAGIVPRNALVEGDCLAVMSGLPDDCVDALVTDPPSSISFMGAEWDGDRGGRDEWVAWMTEVARECLRVMKPGAHGLVWALPRTSHWTGWALETAGFEIRDQVLHLFAQGFPKNHSLSKAVAKMASGHVPAGIDIEPLNGLGTALKPAHEVWWLVRKPLDGTVAENVLRWDVGALDIDGCRVPFVNAADLEESVSKNQHADFGTQAGGNAIYGDYSMVTPRNYDPSRRASRDTAAPGGEGPQPGGGREGRDAVARERVGGGAKGSSSFATGYAPRAGHRTATFGDVGGETQPGGDGSGGWQANEVGRWPANVVLTDPVLDRGYPDEVVGGGTSGPGVWGSSNAATDPAFNRSPGRHEYRSTASVQEEGRLGKSRYFMIPKAGRGDRDTGVPQAGPVENDHITVKPLALMRHLVRLVTPPGGLVLDPFAGSGTTGVATALEGEGRAYLLIEQEPGTASIARARLGL